MRDVRNNEMSTLWYSQYLFIMCNILHSHLSCPVRPIGHVYLVKYCILSKNPSFAVDFCQNE